MHDFVVIFRAMVEDTGKWSLVWEATTWTLDSMTFDTPNHDYRYLLTLQLKLVVYKLCPKVCFNIFNFV